MEVTTPCWFVFSFLKVDTGTHNHLARYGLPPSGNQHPAPTCEWPSPPQCPGPSPHLGSSCPSQPRGSDILMQGITRLLWLTRDLPASPCCFLEDYTGEEKRMKGWGWDQMGEAPRGADTRRWGPGCAGFESSLYSLPATSEPVFICKAVITSLLVGFLRRPFAGV